MKIPTRLAAAALGLALLHGPAPAQDGDEPERLDAWPELSRDAERSVALDIDRLRKARTPEMAEFAVEGLVGAGAGTAPKLLKALGAEKKEAAQERLEAVLTRICDERHTRLLAAQFDHDAVAVRRWCLARAAAFPDPGTRDAAAAAFQRLEELSRKKKPRGYDEAEHDAAAMAATAAGSHAALARMHALTLERWGARWQALRAALEGARDAESTAFCAQLLGDEAGRREVVAALNLLSGCGTAKEAVPLVRPYLDHEDNSIRVAAINALRGIVDGEPPIPKLSVFDAIEMASEWKRRV